MDEKRQSVDSNTERTRRFELAGKEFRATAAGRKNDGPSKDIPVLSPQTYLQVMLQAKGELRLQVARQQIRKVSWTVWAGPREDVKAETQRAQSRFRLGDAMKEAGGRAGSRGGEGKETESLLKPPERMQLCCHLALAPVRPGQTSELQN